MKKTIRFLPDDITCEVEEGESLLTAAANAGVYIHAFCGGDGVCGKCKVVVEAGQVAAAKAMQLRPEEEAQGIRLACQSKVMEDITVRIPEEIAADGRSLKRKPKTTRAISAR